MTSWRRCLFHRHTDSVSVKGYARSPITHIRRNRSGSTSRWQSPGMLTGWMPSERSVLPERFCTAVPEGMPFMEDRMSLRRRCITLRKNCWVSLAVWSLSRGSGWQRNGRQMLPAEEDVCSLSIQCMTCLKRLTWQDELSGSGAPLLP